MKNIIKRWLGIDDLKKRVSRLEGKTVNLTEDGNFELQGAGGFRLVRRPLMGRAGRPNG